MSAWFITGVACGMTARAAPATPALGLTDPAPPPRIQLHTVARLGYVQREPDTWLGRSLSTDRAG